MTWTLLAACCYAGYVFCRARLRRGERAERRAASYRAEARAFEAGYEEGCKPVQAARDLSARVFELYDSEAMAGEALELQLAAALAAVAACEHQLQLRDAAPLADQELVDCGHESALKPGQRVYVAPGRVFGVVAEVLDMGILDRVSVSVLLDGGGAGLYAPSDLYIRGDEGTTNPRRRSEAAGGTLDHLPRAGLLGLMSLGAAASPPASSRSR